VEVSLLTYDLGHVISNLDVELARKMDELAAPLSP
jgi:4a-hydroxytetrahydrobiopterin dehydratase